VAAAFIDGAPIFCMTQADCFAKQPLLCGQNRLLAACSLRKMMQCVAFINSQHCVAYRPQKHRAPFV
jgi:hypothetical protein